jgi:hypothetical protein
VEQVGRTKIIDSTALEYPGDFTEVRAGVFDMLEHIIGDACIETLAGKGEDGIPTDVGLI